MHERGSVGVSVSVVFRSRGLITWLRVNVSVYKLLPELSLLRVDQAKSQLLPWKKYCNYQVRVLAERLLKCASYDDTLGRHARYLSIFTVIILHYSRKDYHC